MRHEGVVCVLSTDRVVELAGVEDLGAGEKAERSKLPHDVLTHTVGQAGVTLRVTGQSEDVLQHPRQGVPAVLSRKYSETASWYFVIQLDSSI